MPSMIVSQTCLFANLGIANAQSRLLNLNFNFAYQLWRCHNPLVSLVIDKHIVLLAISLVSRISFLLVLLRYGHSLSEINNNNSNTTAQVLIKMPPTCNICCKINVDSIL